MEQTITLQILIHKKMLLQSKMLKGVYGKGNSKHSRQVNTTFGVLEKKNIRKLIGLYLK